MTSPESKSFSEAFILFRRLRTLISWDRRDLMLGAVLLSAGSLLPLAAPLLIGRAVEFVTRPDRSSHLTTAWILCLALFALQGIMFAVRYFKEVQSQKWGEGFVYRVRLRLFEHLLILSPGYHDRERVGALAHRVLEESRVIKEMVQEGIGAFLVSPISFLGMFAVMMALDWKMTLVVMAPVPLLLGTMMFFVGRLREINRRLKNTGEDLASFLQQRLSGIRTIQVLAQEREEFGRFDLQAVAFLDLKIRMARLWGRYLPLMGWITSSSILLVLLYAGLWSSEEGIGVRHLVTFLGYSAMLYAPIIEMTRIHHVWQNLVLSAERIFAVLDERPAVTDLEDAVELSDPDPAVCLERVSFGYEPGKLILDDVSWTIPFGTTVGLSGRTGTGKSTLARLLVRWHDPTSGRVTLGGHDLRRLRLRSLRGRVVLMSQEEFLFDDTLRNNVAYGNSSVSTRELEEVLDGLHISEIVGKWPSGWETVIGERGVALSAGERQKVVLARCMVRFPDMLILDEATSAMDQDTERDVLNWIAHRMAGRTLIVISHRESALESCSMRLDLVNGKIVPLSGSPA